MLAIAIGIRVDANGSSSGAAANPLDIKDRTGLTITDRAGATIQSRT